MCNVLDMQVQKMLSGETACPTLSNPRKKWARDEASLCATVQGNLSQQKTKYYIEAVPGS